MKITELFEKVSIPEMQSAWSDANLPEPRIDRISLPHYQVRMFRDKYVLMGECLNIILGKKDWNLIDLADYMQSLKSTGEVKE